MDVVVWVILGVALIAMVIVIPIEARIMHKPEAERTDRERAFIRRDRAAARGYQAYSRNVAPWIVVGLAVLGVVVVLPLWFSGRTGVAAGMTALFVGMAALGVGLRVFVSRRRGPAWQQEQDAANRDADAVGRPRWFGSVRSGLILGAVFFVIGAAFIVLGLMSGHFNWWSVVMLPVAVLVIVLALVQRRGEQRTRPAQTPDA